ncbi:CopG family transcriptional regulator [Methylobacterium aquaticum]|uniref:ribbon-helix-helix domain-containing protein n=1 Tax=Methylobacterium aquaticum TaxID=270351 RepID=UPI003D165156
MTEALRVAVPLETKVAVDAAAQRRGVSAAAFVRDAVGAALAGSGTPQPQDTALPPASRLR